MRRLNGGWISRLSGYVGESISAGVPLASRRCAAGGLFEQPSRWSSRWWRASLWIFTNGSLAWVPVTVRANVNVGLLPGQEWGQGRRWSQWLPITLPAVCRTVLAVDRPPVDWRYSGFIPAALVLYPLAVCVLVSVWRWFLVTIQVHILNFALDKTIFPGDSWNASLGQYFYRWRLSLIWKPG